MAKDRWSLLPGEGKDEDAGEEERHRHSDGYSTDEQERGGSRKKRKRGNHTGSRRSPRRAQGSSSEGERGEDSSEQDSSTGDSASEESQKEMCRRMWERRRKEREHEKEKRRKEKEMRRKEREYEERRRKEKARRRKEREHGKEGRRKGKERRKAKDEEQRKKEEDLGKKDAVTNYWGKYGVIRETDIRNKGPEFTAWLTEVNQVNLDILSKGQYQEWFTRFMADYNMARFPSKKYYNLDAYHRHMMTEDMKKGTKKATEVERTVFNDEEIRRDCSHSFRGKVVSPRRDRSRYLDHSHSFRDQVVSSTGDQSYSGGHHGKSIHASWEAPAMGFLKANSDGSVVPPQSGGWGYVIRNYKRECLATGCGQVTTGSVLASELSGMVAALERCLTLRPEGKDLILESDSLNAIELLKASNQEYYDIIHTTACARKLKERCKYLQIQYLPRSLNKTADALARHGRLHGPMNSGERLPWEVEKELRRDNQGPPRLIPAHCIGRNFQPKHL